MNCVVFYWKEKVYFMFTELKYDCLLTDIARIIFEEFKSELLETGNKCLCYTIHAMTVRNFYWRIVWKNVFVFHEHFPRHWDQRFEFGLFFVESASFKEMHLSSSPCISIALLTCEFNFLHCYRKPLACLTNNNVLDYFCPYI